METTEQMMSRTVRTTVPGQVLHSIARDWLLAHGRGDWGKCAALLEEYSKYA